MYKSIPQKKMRNSVPSIASSYAWTTGAFGVDIAVYRAINKQTFSGNDQLFIIKSLLQTEINLP